MHVSLTSVPLIHFSNYSYPDYKVLLYTAVLLTKNIFSFDRLHKWCVICGTIQTTQNLQTQKLEPEMFVIWIHILICSGQAKQGIIDVLNCATSQQSQLSIISLKTPLSWLHQPHSSRSWDRFSLHAYFICFIFCFIFLRVGLPQEPNFLLGWCQSSWQINSWSKPRRQNFSCFPVCLAGYKNSEWADSIGTLA